MAGINAVQALNIAALEDRLRQLQVYKLTGAAADTAYSGAANRLYNRNVPDLGALDALVAGPPEALRLTLEAAFEEKNARLRAERCLLHNGAFANLCGSC